MASQDVLTRTLVELADTLVDDFDVVDVLTLLVDRSIEAFDVEAAGVMLASPIGSELRVIASSSPTMRSLELYEIQVDDGPCMDCYASGNAVLDQNIAAAHSRWPHFAPAAEAAGFKSVSAIPLRLRDTTIGALNLFRTEPGKMGDENIAAARAFAAVATIAILQHQAATDALVLNGQLNHALSVRVVIEQAKGMLAERSGSDVDASFENLRTYARRNNLLLASVAQNFLDGNVSLADIGVPN